MKDLPIPAFILLIALFASCNTKFLETEATVVSMKQGSTNQKLGDLFTLEGFTALESNPSVDLEGITKILFKEDKAIVLNYVGDIQELWVFDQKSGKVLSRIGVQNNEPDGYNGLNDIAFDGEEIRCSVAGKMAFMNYDLGGNLRSTINDGVFGEELEQNGNGEFVVYNEYNATRISGYNHLIFYDRAGNVTKRAYPYIQAQDGNGYRFAGSLTASDGLWFNPPFCDTMFEIRGHSLYPRYVFDFGENAMPEAVRLKKLTGWDTNKYSFISEGFAKTGRFMIFEYYDEQKIKIGAYDDVTNRFVSLRDLKEDYLYELLQLGDIFPKAGNTFALVLRPARIQYLVKKNMIDLEALERNQPGLAAALTGVTENSNPVILYLSFKPGASIQDIAVQN